MNRLSLLVYHYLLWYHTNSPQELSKATKKGDDSHACEVKLVHAKAAHATAERECAAGHIDTETIKNALVKVWNCVTSIHTNILIYMISQVCIRFTSILLVGAVVHGGAC